MTYNEAQTSDLCSEQCPPYASKTKNWAVVVAQLAEWSLPTPEDCYSNPDISKLTVNCIEKTKIKKNSSKMDHFF